MLNPELAIPFVAAGQCKAVIRFRMREIGRVKIQAEAAFFRPVHPPAEMLRAHVVALDFAAEISLNRLKIDAMPAGNQAQRLIQIGA